MDADSLRTTQYRDSRKLSARIGLHQRFSTNPYGWHRWVFDHLSLPKTARVLEVGCGAGDLWRLNAHRVPTGWWVALSDFSVGMASDARRALTDRRFRYLAADAQQLPLPCGSLDCVIANHMLYHVSDVAQALSEFRRVLRSGGRLFAATNGDGHLCELWSLVADAGVALDGAMHGHGVAAFTLANAPALLSRHFADVTLNRYEDALEITEAEPLVAYVASIIPSPPPASTELARFQRLVERRLAAHGSVHIGKEAGLFVGRKE